MFKTGSSTIVCPSCGNHNPAREKFCLACAARLGREPSIAQGAAGNAAARSQPAVLQAAAPSDANSFWFRCCMAGLLILIAFLGWAWYVMSSSGSQAGAPQQAAVPIAPAAPAAPSVNSQTAPADTAPVGGARPTAVAPAAPPAPTASPLTAAAMAQQQRSSQQPQPQQQQPALQAQGQGQSAQSQPQAQQALSQPPQQARVPRQRGFESRRTAAAAPDPLDEPIELPSSRQPPAADWQRRALPYEPGDALPPRAASPSRQTVIPAPDAGPPIVVGPGPLYDYSTPGATGR